MYQVILFYPKTMIKQQGKTNQKHFETKYFCKAWKFFLCISYKQTNFFHVCKPHDRSSILEYLFMRISIDHVEFLSVFVEKLQSNSFHHGLLPVSHAKKKNLNFCYRRIKWISELFQIELKELFSKFFLWCHRSNISVSPMGLKKIFFGERKL